MATKYVNVNWNTSKATKAAQAEYEKAYAVMRKCDAHRKACKAVEMAKAGHIPAGTEPVFKTRPWDGQMQVLKDETTGAFEYQVPKAKQKASQETI